MDNKSRKRLRYFIVPPGSDFIIHITPVLAYVCRQIMPIIYISRINSAPTLLRPISHHTGEVYENDICHDSYVCAL